jgi:hypothetical protein
MQAKQVKMAAAALMATVLMNAGAATHVALKRPFDPPPSADLTYSLKAQQKGITLGGEGVVNWRADAGKYSVATRARVPVFGNILENRSEGTIDAYGLAPAKWVEKRFRKDPNTTTFERDEKRITFSVGEKTFPILGGEQDRASAQWQMVAVARAAPEKMTAGSEWKFFVAGRRDAEAWTFKVVGREKVQTGLGSVEAVHLSKSPPADYPDQRLDLWLAPSKQWYPVKLRLEEDDGEFVEQTLDKIERR